MTRKSSKRCSAARINLHNNYQDFQAFLDHGGHIGLQHDPLLYGAYALNPFLVGVEMVPMIVIKQGQVARHQSIRRPRYSGHQRCRFQIWFTGSPGSSRRLAGASAHRKISAESAMLRAGNRSDRYPQPELGGCRQRSPQPRRAAPADRREVEGGFRLQNRSASADPRAGHQSPARHLHGGHHEEPGHGSSPGRGRQPLP